MECEPATPFLTLNGLRFANRFLCTLKCFRFASLIMAICEDKNYNGATMKEIIDFYNQISSGFEESIQERTPHEIAYDKVAIKELKKGRTIKKALKMVNKKYPNEALQYDKDNINDIASHYDYLLNHESIINKIKQASH